MLYQLSYFPIAKTCVVYHIPFDERKGGEKNFGGR